MPKIMGKKEIKVVGVTFDGRQGKLWNLKKNLDGAWLSLERRAADEDKNRIYVIANVKDQRPFRIGTIPTNISFWLAPKMDAAIARAEKNNTKPANEYLVRLTDFEIVGGGNMYLGVRANLIYEIQKTA